MTIPKIDSTPISTDPLTPIPHTLEVGELTIEGRSYIVSVESSDPLIAKPESDTIKKIQYLVNLHLNHLTYQGADLSKIVIQQLDEKGLSYTNEDLEQKSLPSSELNFVPFSSSDENSSYPLSLQNPSISNISDVYRSIIDPLIKVTENREEKTSSTDKTKCPNGYIIFTPTDLSTETPEDSSEESSASSKSSCKGHTKSDVTIDDDADDTVEAMHRWGESIAEPNVAQEQDYTEGETTGLISGASKDSSEFEYSGIFSTISNFASSIWNALPNFRTKADNTQEPIINTQKIIEKEQSTFRNGFSEQQESDFIKFTNIKFQ